MTDRRPTVVARLLILEQRVEDLTRCLKALSRENGKTLSLVKDTLREYEFLDQRELPLDGGVVPPSAHNAKAL